ncbi:hypothetical protein QUA56_19910 [Microcoleus sp. N3A4]|uniref:hypothetical protein n=1 Tax=Microcoleus sp. N3A4 TaxID=3055379 RepID=UPI002FD687E2
MRRKIGRSRVTDRSAWTEPRNQIHKRGKSFSRRSDSAAAAEVKVTADRPPWLKLKIVCRITDLYLKTEENIATPT